MEHENITGIELPLFGQICATFSLKEQDARQYSPLTLAYIGDAVYEMIVRTILVERGNAPVNVLHKHASKLVKAEAQADAYHRIKEQLTEEEMSVFRRGRNAKSYTSAKNATIGDYRMATGFEALFGYWYLTGQTERMLTMAKAGMTEDNTCDTKN
ncbi:MAG: ribonuclease III [Lachnospiraceae bacterium]|nr:ribonuclease III [Lachnospiraceae bacterium]